VIVAAIASQAGDPPQLEAGLELYRAGDLKGSLPLLLDSLDTGTTKQRATARLYVGLIQHRTGNTIDAGASFKRALELWPQIRPPRSTPRPTLDAFERVRERVAPEPPPPPTKPRERKRSSVKETTEGGPEILEPVEGESLGSSRDWSVEQADANEEDPLSLAEPAPPPEDDGVPVLGWVAGGVGAAAAITGITLAILAGVNGRRALDEPDKARASELHGSASAQNKAALGSFGAAGVMFGVAALTVMF
jgi:hypothetical protein